MTREPLANLPSVERCIVLPGDDPLTVEQGTRIVVLHGELTLNVVPEEDADEQYCVVRALDGYDTAIAHSVSIENCSKTRVKVLLC